MFLICIVLEAHGLPEGEEYSYSVMLSVPYLEKSWETEPSPKANWEASPVEWEIPAPVTGPLIFHIINTISLHIVGQVCLAPGTPPNFLFS